MEQLYRQRPFKTRNADEYNLSDILSLFINPLTGLSLPTDFENSIVKGRMGSGKTMFLRANHAFYLFSMIPRLLEDEELILPVFLKLNDFQHIQEPNIIYAEIIKKIIEELSTIYLRLQNAKEMANIHEGIKKLPRDLYFDTKLSATADLLLKLGSEEYVKRISTEFGLEGKIKHSFFEASSKLQKNVVVEIKAKTNPGIKDVTNCFEMLLSDSGGKILLLIDEAGTLDKRFFRDEKNDAFFEILMNQFRTSEFIRTKIAIYPNSYSDILTETRYGDIVPLDESVDELISYRNYRTKTISLINNYLNSGQETLLYKAEDLFDINSNSIYGDCIEQLINGSGGNMRRLIQLLDMTMNIAYQENGGSSKITKEHSITALESHCDGIVNLYSEQEREFLKSLAKTCKSRGTFKFKFPNNAPVLYKYMTKSQEFNLLYVIEAGTGRRGTTYKFDYAYCIQQDIPTHNLRETERIDKNRSLEEGEWVRRVTNVSNEIIAQACIPGKIDGEIIYLNNDKGFVKGEDGVEYFFSRTYVIEEDINKRYWTGKKIRFNPAKIDDSNFAFDIEIL